MTKGSEVHLGTRHLPVESSVATRRSSSFWTRLLPVFPASALLLCALCLHTQLPVASAVNEEGTLLLEWRASFNNLTRLLNWKASDTSPCLWEGVTCGGGQGYVTELHLSTLFTGGRLSPQLANLSHLEWLEGSGNNLSGPIPESLGQLQNLRALDLSANHLSGPIPPSLGQLQGLECLGLSDNALSGVIPPELSNCPNLRSLDLSNNKLEGELPATLWGLRVLWVDHNELTGSIPERLISSEKVVDGQVIPFDGRFENNFLLGVEPETAAAVYVSLAGNCDGYSRVAQRFIYYKRGPRGDQRPVAECAAKYNSLPPPPPGRIPPPPTPNSAPLRPQTALRPGAIAGVASGSAALMLACCILVGVSWWRRRKDSEKNKKAGSGGNTEGPRHLGMLHSHV